MASNPYVNKVQLADGSTLIDVSVDTATASDVAQGKYFHLATGERVQGTATGGGGTTAGTVTQDQDGYIVLDDEAPTPPTPTPTTVYYDNDVIFMDYDGEIVYSCTAAEALAMTELPANPSHNGLTAQGWNYTLAEMKAEVNDHGFCDIGQNYVTSDGKTRIYVTMTAPCLNPSLGLGINGTVSVDWGDGSTADTMTGSSLTAVVYQAHTYATSGAYVIAITVVSGSFRICGNASNPAGSRLFVKNSTSTENQAYMAAVQKVEMGSDAVAGAYAFNQMPNLETVSIPTDGMLNNTNYIFNNTLRSLKCIVVPSGYTTFGRAGISDVEGMKRISLPASITNWAAASSSFFALRRISFPKGCTNFGALLQSCYCVLRVNLPSGMTTIPASAFYNDWGLSSLTIPATVTSIGTYAFYRCYGMKEYHFKSTSVPSLANVSAFEGIPSDCIIYVPSESLSDYQSETNWSTYADYMVGE